MTGSSNALKHYAAIALGMILMLTPLALWVAWTGTMFFIVLAIGAAAAVLYCLLPGDQESAHAKPDQRNGPTVLSDEFLTELTKLGPWIYHNRRPGDPVFQRKIDRVLKLLR